MRCLHEDHQRLVQLLPASGVDYRTIIKTVAFKATVRVSAEYVCTDLSCLIAAYSDNADTSLAERCAYGCNGVMDVHGHSLTQTFRLFFGYPEHFSGNKFQMSTTQSSQL